MDDKWKMFKNYMHNELGITKYDIKQWIEDAVERQAEALVKHQFDNFDVASVVQKIITDDNYFGQERLKHEIATELSRQILSRLEFTKNDNEEPKFYPPTITLP
jgi:hypothetical protein